jgi:hypothetical protein
MQTTEIYEKLNGVFRSVFADDTIVVGLTTERTFGVKFSAYEVNQLRNVGQLVELVQAKLARQ